MRRQFFKIVRVEGERRAKVVLPATNRFVQVKRVGFSIIL
jgi:hypothetical protein